MRSLAFWTMFILLIIALAIAFFFLGQNINYKSTVDSLVVDLGECMDSKGYLPAETMDCDCEKCPEVDMEFLEFCKSLPINQEAVIEKIPTCDDARYCIDLLKSMMPFDISTRTDINWCLEMVKKCNFNIWNVEPIVDLPIIEEEFTPPVDQPPCLLWVEFKDTGKTCAKYEEIN